jgi:hypothetical protein
MERKGGGGASVNDGARVSRFSLAHHFRRELIQLSGYALICEDSLILNRMEDLFQPLTDLRVDSFESMQGAARTIPVHGARPPVRPHGEWGRRTETDRW